MCTCLAYATDLRTVVLRVVLFALLFVLFVLCVLFVLYLLCVCVCVS